MDSRTPKTYRIIYMGTPDFAVPPLSALCETEEVVLAVTQPDRRAGRGRKFTVSPVKEEVLNRGIPLLQPERVNTPEVIAALREVSCDIIVVAAFGQILKPEILEIPPYGCINIHASLLPKYRGASPIVTALVQGEKTTGVTTMMMDQGMDTGDILLRMTCDIPGDLTAGELTEKLSMLGAQAILRTIEDLRADRLQRQPQLESKATYTSLLTKKQGLIDWNKEPVEIQNLVRGMDPWPGAYTVFQGETLKVWRVTPFDEPGTPGKILNAKDRLIVGTKGGSVIIDELQLPGKKKVLGPDILRGRHGFKEGMILGE